MDIPVKSANSTRLYALQLHLRPLHQGTLMPFSGELVHVQDVHRESEKAPFLHLGKQLFWLEDVQLMPEASADWVGFTSLPQLIEQAQQKRLPPLPVVVDFYRSVAREPANATAASRLSPLFASAPCTASSKKKQNELRAVAARPARQQQARVARPARQEPLAGRIA